MDFVVTQFSLIFVHLYTQLPHHKETDEKEKLIRNYDRH